jgi:hypothetical protein
MSVKRKEELSLKFYLKLYATFGDIKRKLNFPSICLQKKLILTADKTHNADYCEIY